jgi:nucleoside-diphosphate-sugar epimerase
VTWLVTGGAGFLGLHLLPRLTDAAIPVRALDVLPIAAAPAGVETLLGDVRDPEAVRGALAGCDVVVHAAAALPGTREMEDVNVHATEQLARLAREAGVRRALFVSTAVVYGLRAPPSRETDTPSPIDAYGRSKARAERAWMEHAPAPLVLRPTAFVGPERLGVFGILFRWVAEGRRIYVPGGGCNRYHLLDVDDLVTAVCLAGRRDVTGVVNVGGLMSGTVRDDLDALIAHAATSSRVVGVPDRPVRAGLALLGAVRLSPLSTWHRRSAGHDIVLDCTRAEALLGWRATRTGALALQRAYDWYVQHGAAGAAGTGQRFAWHERALGVLRRVS